ncbi:MAG: peptide chain release factor 2 [Dehalococcoidia bacterium]|nr:peptide chain release factor 2 [Dehalococcoidia bacterium]
MQSPTVFLRSWCIFDIARKEENIAELEEETAQPDFWRDPQLAQQKMRHISALKNTVGTWRDLERRSADLAALVDMSLEAEDSSLQDDITRELDILEAELNDQEIQLQLSGEYDGNHALLAVHAGAGGTESQDWAQILLRMYLRWAEKRKYDAEVIEVSPGEEAGIKSALVEIRGDYSYGYLKGERGVHRLVRISPFDASHSRHTSFALVEVMPVVESDVEVGIDPADIKVDVFRSSGPGGQHMQKTSSAVRLTHIPTGTVVTCQSERSQHRNKETAMMVLRSRLLELQLEKNAEEQARLKGEHVTADWGNQIRSYVLQPYKLVKDHRTGYETSDTSAVLEGDIDDLLKAYLSHTIQG